MENQHKRLNEVSKKYRKVLWKLESPRGGFSVPGLVRLEEHIENTAKWINKEKVIRTIEPYADFPEVCYIIALNLEEDAQFNGGRCLPYHTEILQHSLSQKVIKKFEEKRYGCIASQVSRIGELGIHQKERGRKVLPEYAETVLLYLDAPIYAEFIGRDVDYAESEEEIKEKLKKWRSSCKCNLEKFETEFREDEYSRIIDDLVTALLERKRYNIGREFSYIKMWVEEINLPFSSLEEVVNAETNATLQSLSESKDIDSLRITYYMWKNLEDLKEVINSMSKLTKEWRSNVNLERIKRLAEDNYTYIRDRLEKKVLKVGLGIEEILPKYESVIKEYLKQRELEKDKENIKEIKVSINWEESFSPVKVCVKFKNGGSYSYRLNNIWIYLLKNNA